MVNKQVALDVAAFLDSPRVQALEGPSPAQVRRIAETFLEICYDDLGKAPHLLDGQDAHEALGHLLPGRLKRRDPLAEHVGPVLGALVGHLEDTRMVSESFELRRGIEATLPEFQEAVRTGEQAHHAPAPRQEPLVHQAPKLGRNDPCFCGSGKKFKKCHGKGA